MSESAGEEEPLSDWETDDEDDEYARPPGYDLSLGREDEREHVLSVMRASIKDSSDATYQKLLDGLAKWILASKDLAIPVIGSEEEKEIVQDYAHVYVVEWGRSGNTIKKGLHSALVHNHALKKVKPSWTADVDWKKYREGLVALGKQPVWRFPWPEEMVLQMVDQAVKLREWEPAVMILISFYGLTRSSFLSIVSVSDVQTKHDVSGTLKRFFPEGCEEMYTVWVSNIKTRKHNFEGGYVRIPDYKSAITKLLEVERPDDDRRLFRFWNCDRLLKMLKNYASLSNVIVLGYRFDIHALKNGGVVAALAANLEASLIRQIAKWVPESSMIEHYGAALPPSVACRVKKAPESRMSALKCKAARAPLKASAASRKRESALQEKMFVPETQVGHGPAPPQIEQVDVESYVVEMVLPDELPDETPDKVARAGGVVCVVCELEGVYAPVKCRACLAEVHRGCSSYGMCKMCRRPRKRPNTGDLVVAVAAVNSHVAKSPRGEGSAKSQAIVLSDSQAVPVTRKPPSVGQAKKQVVEAMVPEVVGQPEVVGDEPPLRSGSELAGDGVASTQGKSRSMSDSGLVVAGDNAPRPKGLTVVGASIDPAEEQDLLIRSMDEHEGSPVLDHDTPMEDAPGVGGKPAWGGRPFLADEW